MGYRPRPIGGRPWEVHLLDGLVSHWKQDEASGNALDAQGTSDLTDNNGVGAAAGKLDGARTFNGSNQFFSIADNADLSMGDIGFSIALWAFPNANSGFVLAKWDTSINSREYAISLSTNNTFFSASPNGVGQTNVLGPALTLAAWNLMIAWHDPVADTINLQVNNGPVGAAAYAAGVSNGTAPFVLGSNNGVASFYNGRLDSISIAKRVWTFQERHALWNSGNGLRFEGFTP